MTFSELFEVSSGNSFDLYDEYGEVLGSLGPGPVLDDCLFEEVEDATVCKIEGYSPRNLAITLEV